MTPGARPALALASEVSWLELGQWWPGGLATRRGHHTATFGWTGPHVRSTNGEN
jgi:hypothetical protein